MCGFSCVKLVNNCPPTPAVAAGAGAAAAAAEAIMRVVVGVDDRAAVMVAREAATVAVSLRTGPFCRARNILWIFLACNRESIISISIPLKQESMLQQTKEGC